SGSGETRPKRRRRAATPPMSEINVTPFVDVMLVLLIIFMVAAPLLTVGVPLELPKTRADALPQEQEEPLTINIDGSGKVYIQKSAIAPDELVAKLTAISAQRESKKIYLRADRSLDYGLIMQVMGDLNAGGFKSIGLVTDQAVTVPVAAETVD
ncbi:MAG: protein TolR, partial [Pseudomonadota bacterium]